MSILFWFPIWFEYRSLRFETQHDVVKLPIVLQLTILMRNFYIPESLNINIFEFGNSQYLIYHQEYPADWLFLEGKGLLSVLHPKDNDLLKYWIQHKMMKLNIIFMAA